MTDDLKTTETTEAECRQLVVEWYAVWGLGDPERVLPCCTSHMHKCVDIGHPTGLELALDETITTSDDEVTEGEWTELSWEDRWAVCEWVADEHDEACSQWLDDDEEDDEEED